MIVVINGTVIDPANNRVGDYDVVIDEGRVVSVDAPGLRHNNHGVEVIDARGKWVVPGLIDLHVHLREPGFEWKETIESGARAAVLGGFTTVCCMPNTRPTNDHAEISRFIVERAAHANLARVLPIGAVSLGLEGKEMAPLSELKKAGCVAFSDDGEPVFNAGLMRRALEWARMLDVPVCCHEEDKAISCGGSMNESPHSLRLGLRGWPKVAEEVMIARDIELARATGGRVHFCHVSTARGVELIRRAKNDGIAVTAEVTPHHLVLTEDRVGSYDTNAKMSPPLRDEEDCEALCRGVNEGVIDAIASDHAPHDIDAKNCEFDRASFGIIGFPTTLPLTLGLVREGVISRERAVAALAVCPAKIIGRKDIGALGKGCAGDLVVIDPAAEWSLDDAQIVSKSKNTPFLGEAFIGKASEVVVGGVVKVRRGTVVEVE